jgi:hypothetical protein
LFVAPEIKVEMPKVSEKSLSAETKIPEKEKTPYEQTTEYKISREHEELMKKFRK